MKARSRLASQHNISASTQSAHTDAPDAVTLDGVEGQGMRYGTLCSQVKLIYVEVHKLLKSVHMHSVGGKCRGTQG